MTEGGVRPAFFRAGAPHSPKYPEPVLERLSEIEQEYEDTLALLSQPNVASDQNRFRDLSRKHKQLENIVNVYRPYRQALDDLETAKEMLTEAQGDDRDTMRAEVEDLEATITRLDDELKVLLLPQDPNHDRNVVVEIRGAEGGEEANLFAKDLFDMYLRYADRMGWKHELLASDPSDKGGYNEVSLLLKGDGVWTRMKHEGGPHRVQRVPVTESQGRIHTSSATVTVLPEAEEVEVDIDPNDLQIDVYRSGGPGGQSVNTTDSAVRITHKPTGVVVAIQDEKSQTQNKLKAMVVLRARLLKAEQDKQSAELSDARRSQVGGGGRSEKIRTYNYKDNRVTDHRINLTLYKLDKILMGELDEVSDALVSDERARQLRGDA
jgi:peptide chain release factor 1